MSVVFTIGHGTRTLDELVDVLKSADVGLLVDVRRFPRSRRHPHVNTEALAVELPKRGIDYAWRGGPLGGRRRPSPGSRHMAWREEGFRGYADWTETETFRAALRELKGEAESGRAPCIMCAETMWWRCHRRLIADMLRLDAFDVVHLVSPTQRQPHPANELLRVDAQGRPVYDVGCLPL